MEQAPATSKPELRSRFLALALPSIAASLMVPLASLVDAAILGHLEGLEPLAGVALAGIIFDMLYWSLGFLRMGTTGLTAQAYGRREGLEIRALLLRAVVVAGVLATVLVLFQGPIATLAFAVLDGEAPVERTGRAYFDARIWAAPAVLFNFCVTGWLIGLQRTRPILVLATVSNGVNVVLDYLFVVELDWGAAGAGWATTGSQILSLFVAVPIAARAWRELRAEEEQEQEQEQEQGQGDGQGDGGARASPVRREDVLSWTKLRPLLRLGRDIWLRTLALISAFAIFTNFSAAFSSTLLAANALLLRVLGLASYFVDGFAHATESLTGEFAGSEDSSGQRRLLAMALRWGVGTGAAFAVAFLAFPGLFTVLTDQPELLAAVVDARGWLVVVLLLGSLAYVFDGYFIGLAAGGTLARAMLLSFGLGFLPLALVARYAGGGPTLLWLALIVFMAARGLTLALAIPGTLRGAQDAGESQGAGDGQDAP